MLYQRELENVSLKDVQDQLRSNTQSWTGELSTLNVSLNGETPVVEIPGRGEIPFPTHAQVQLASRLKVPGAYYNRIPSDLKQNTMETLLNFTAEEGYIAFTNQGVELIQDPKKVIITPADIVETALDYFPEDSLVVDVEYGDEFVLDVLYGPEGDDTYVGGDLQVNDITRGGVRFAYNLKTQAKPSVSPYLYRLVCTNGMETLESSLKLTVEGSTPQEYLLALGNFTESALGLINSRIREFYALREARIDSEPLMALSRLASTYGLSALTVKRLASHLPVSPRETMFDLVNIITNEANNPEIEAKPAQRRKLQRVGGSVVVDHHGFCDNCGNCL